MGETIPSLLPDFERNQNALESSDDADLLPPQCPSRLVRAARFVAWDGGLPLAVAVIPFALDTLGGGWKVIAAIACVFVPLIAAFMRCEVGLDQIRTRVRNPPPIVRQVFLAAAIAVLFGFEMGVGFLLIDGNAPVEVWRIAAGLYVVYLALIWAALRSTPGNAASCG